MFVFLKELKMVENVVELGLFLVKWFKFLFLVFLVFVSDGIDFGFLFDLEYDLLDELINFIELGLINGGDIN